MTDNNVPNIFSKPFRAVCSFVDTIVYSLLAIMYQIFFNVASADLFSMEIVLGFYKRVQLIIGVYMVFHLAVLIMKGIFNTDTVSGKNNNEFIKKVIIALTMLTVLTPINIPNAQNEYEKQINNNGLLFGTLYSLQNRILSNNTIGRLVLGTNDTYTSTGTYDEIKTRDEKLETAANTFSITVLKGFLRVNLIPKKDRSPTENGEAPETLNENRMCQDMDTDTKKLYLENDTAPGDLLALVNATCVPKGNIISSPINKALSYFGLSNKTKFMFAYMPVASTIVGILFTFLLISFTVGVAVRAIKLSVLRLIAPIPIISYMDPNGSKDSGFNSWVKTLTQTYLDLFIRLATVYFVIYLIQDMITNGIYMNAGNDIIGVISFIFICIGLFIFAKEAPKFFQQAMGMKNEPTNFFGKAFGTAASITGSVGSFRAGMRASRLSDETRQAFGENVDPNSFLNRGKHLLAGIAGGAGGLATGYMASQGAKEKSRKAAIDAMNKRNAEMIAKGNSGSTYLGRIQSNWRNKVAGEGSSAQGERTISSLKSRQAALDKIKSRFSGEMVKKDWTYGDFGGKLSGIKVNYKDANARAAQAIATNQKNFEISDESGTLHTISLADWERQKGYLQKTNENDYLINARNRTHFDYDPELGSLIEDAEAKGAHVTDRSSVTSGPGGSEEIGRQIRNAERQNVINKANDQFSGKK